MQRYVEAGSLLIDTEGEILSCMPIRQKCLIPKRRIAFDF
jgi:hypothetical protein